MKENLLRAKIVELGFNIGSFCKAAGFTQTTFNRKLTGKSEFNLSEIQRMVSTLKMTDEEICNIFFAKLVAEKCN